MDSNKLMIEVLNSLAKEGKKTVSLGDLERFREAVVQDTAQLHAEITALREEIDSAKHKSRLMSAQVHRELIAERDSLRSQLQVAEAIQQRAWNKAIKYLDECRQMELDRITRSTAFGPRPDDSGVGAYLNAKQYVENCKAYALTNPSHALARLARLERLEAVAAAARRAHPILHVHGLSKDLSDALAALDELEEK